MGRPKLRRHLLLAAALTFPQPALAGETEYTVGSGSLADALTALSERSGVQIMADPAVLRGLRTDGVGAAKRVERALDVLLRGTGLTYRHKGKLLLIVRRASPAEHAGGPAARTGDDGGQARTEQPAKALPIVVIGQRFADRRALDVKRRARNILDAISIDEISRLPDSTVVDAMRRIPGVSVLPIADNEHPRDVPIAPVVRGLTQAYNNVTVDGMLVASTGIPDAGSNSASRGVRLDILPASVVSKLLVIKTFTPDLDPNAIGGAIDLQTRGAFDNGGVPFASVEAGIAAASDHGEVQAQSPLGSQFTATVSDTFGPDHRLGIVVSANFRHLNNNSNVHGTADSDYVNFFNDDGTQATSGTQGNGIAVPREDKNWYNGSDRRQWGVTTRLDADLDRVQLSALVADLVFHDRFTRNEVVIDPDTSAVVDQTQTSGHFDSAAIQVGYRDGVTRSETRLARLGLIWSPGPEDRLSATGAISRASLRENYDMVKFTAGLDADGAASGTDALGFDYDTAPLQFNFAVPRAAYTDLSLYPADYWRHRRRSADSRVEALRTDWQHQMDALSGIGFAAGLSVTHSDYRYAFRNEAYETSDRQLTLKDAGFIGDVPLPFSRAGLPLLVIDPERAWQMFDDNAATISRTDDQFDAFKNDFQHRETSLDAYAMARLASGPVEALAGVRLDQTSHGTQGFIEVDDVWQPLNTAARYHQLLPSFQLNIRPASALRLRGGYSRTIGRPSYEDYAPQSSIRFQNGAAQGDGDATGVVVELGNPGIAPRVSDNFDLSAEWSLPRGWEGMLSAAAFHKAIGHEIFDSVTTGYEYDGVYYRYASVSRPTNATAAHVSGLELSAVIGSLGAIAPALRPFGFSANWTMLDGAITVPMTSGAERTVGHLVGQPDSIRNLTLFYNRDGFELRGAINWTGRALRSIAPDTPWEDVYWESRRQIDMQARYHFGRGVSLVVDVSNLTQDRLTSLTGPGASWLKDSYSVPRTVSISLHWGRGR